MKVTKSTSFPLGSNIYSAVHIASQGLLAFDGPQSMARAALEPLAGEAFLAPMNGIAGIVPAEGGSLSYCISPTNFVVTWNNVYACRTNLYPISYQAELKDSGDFSYRFAFSSNFVNSAVATNFKVANLGPAGAVMSFATDSDGDGFEDWKELLAGTLINDPSSRPVEDDGVATLFSATITLAAAQPEPILLTLGGRRVMLREPGSTTLWLNEGVANALSLRAVRGCDVAGLSITIDSSYASYVGDDKPFNGTVRLRSGEQTKFGMVVQPVVSTASNWICFHDEPTRNAHAFVLPEDCPGNPEWAENGSNFTIAGSDSMNAILTWYGAPGCDHLYFEYCLPGTAARRNAYVHVTRCAGHGSSTSSESSSASVALNNDDDDGNGTDDRSDSTVEGENDLTESHPIYGHAQSCCPCYGYGPNPDIIATRTYCSDNLRTYTSPSKITEKTAASPGDSVFVEGREASPTVGAEKIVWSWTEEGEAKASTNYFTIFSVRLFGDYNFDGAINSVDYAAANKLTEHGWPMLVASNMFHKVELKTDVLIPGYKILTLSGDAQIRVWTTANPTINDTPLLITGQTVTNGFCGASFGASPISMLYVEALDSGVATLTYSYVGTGSAEGFGCSAVLGMTAVKVELPCGQKPNYGNCLLWESVGVQSCNFLLSPAHLGTNVEWTLSGFPNSEKNSIQWISIDASGPNKNIGYGVSPDLTFKYSDLFGEFNDFMPPDNNWFGQKSVNVSVADNLTFNVPIWSFFSIREDRERISDNKMIAAWYYYWSLDALPELIDFGYFEVIDEDANIAAQHRFNPITQNTTYKIAKVAASCVLASPVYETGIYTEQDYVPSKNGKGIHAVAKLIKHEKWHSILKKETRSTLLGGDGLSDLDNDGLSLAREIEIGSNPNIADTFDISGFSEGGANYTAYADYGDQELYCRLMQAGILADEYKDWSFPGLNFDNNQE